MFLYLLIDISVPMLIASILLWLCFAFKCERAVMWNTSDILRRAEAKNQPVSCSTGLQPQLPTPAFVICKIRYKAAGLLLSGSARKRNISATLRGQKKVLYYPTPATPSGPILEQKAIAFTAVSVL